MSNWPEPSSRELQEWADEMSEPEPEVIVLTQDECEAIGADGRDGRGWITEASLTPAEVKALAAYRRRGTVLTRTPQPRIAARAAQAEVWSLDRDGTRYQIILVTMPVEIGESLGTARRALVISGDISSPAAWRTWYVFEGATGGFLHWTYVAEKFGLNEADGRNLTALIGAALGRDTSEDNSTSGEAASIEAMA